MHPRSCWGSLQRSLRHLAGFKGAISWWRWEGGKEKGGDGKGKEEEGQGGRESWNRIADWLRPALPRPNE